MGRWICLAKISQQTFEIKEILVHQIGCATNFFLCKSVTVPHVPHHNTFWMLSHISLKIGPKQVRIKFRNRLVGTTDEIFQSSIAIVSVLSFQKDYDLRIKISDYDQFSKDDYVDTLRTHIHFNYSSIISEPILLSGRTQ